MKTEGQGPDLIITDQQNFLQIYPWEDTLRNKRRFLPCYSSKMSCSYLRCSSSNISFNLTHTIITAGIRLTPPSFSLRNLLYVCHMKMPRQMSWGAYQAFGRVGNWGEGKRKSFVLVFGASRSEEVMIVSVPFTFQVRSLQGLVKLETELARRTGCRAQVKQLINRKSFLLAQVEILRIQMLALVQRCLDHCQPARSDFLKRQRPAPY